jgi:hypothetical protein
MRFSYCADRPAFVSAFEKIGLPVKSEDDLITLYDWHTKGLDRAGKIKLSNNTFLNLDIESFVKRIKLRHDVVLNCKIKLLA